MTTYKMAISLKRTGASNQWVNILVHGQSGSGKTTLSRTLENVVILSAEGGLLSVADEQIPYIEISTYAELMEAYQWASESDEAKQFDCVALDSISEMAEVILATEKSKAKDPRQAYGALQDSMSGLIRAFRDLPKHVYMTCKTEKIQDESGRLLWSPSMPGAKLGQQLPYFFDEVFALRVEKDEDGKALRMLQTESDGIWTAKDRSGKLEPWCEPDLGKIISAIGGKK